jgi:hypothetical protein
MSSQHVEVVAAVVSDGASSTMPIGLSLESPTAARIARLLPSTVHRRRRGVDSWIVALVLSAVLAAALPTSANAQTTSGFDASQGVLPDQVCRAWQIDEPARAFSRLLDGNLRIETAEDSARSYYRHVPPSLEVSDPMVVEARVRLHSSASVDPSWGAVRTAASIGITRDARGLGNTFFIARDEVSSWRATRSEARRSTSTPTTASTPNRVELGADGLMEVYYDGALVMVEPAFSDPNPQRSGATHLLR